MAIDFGNYSDNNHILSKVKLEDYYIIINWKIIQNQIKGIIEISKYSWLLIRIIVALFCSVP